MNNPINSSHDDGQPIDALEFEAPGASNARQSQAAPDYSPGATALKVSHGAPWWQSQFNLMLCVFALLAIAALLFIVLTPSPGASTAANTVIAADGSTQAAAPTPIETPYDEKRRAQARTDSQDILSDLLAIKKQLENKDVSEWAAEEFQASLDLAKQGDDFYARQEFVEAIGLYQQASDQMESLNNRIPEILRAKIAEGVQAINQGKSQLAKQKFNQALALDRNSIDALRGLGRANTLDQALDLINSAAQDEQRFDTSDELADLRSAAEKYQQVIEIDKGLKQAAEGQVRVASAITDKEFRQAMSSGFSALFTARNASAKKSFGQALKIKPGDTVATSAYRQSLASDKSASLGSIISSAKRYESNEQWSNAVANYQAALQRDPNQINAKLGLIRSKARADLDQSLLEVMSDPLGLSVATKKSNAQVVLNDARAISRKGAVLQQQIASIENALEQLDKTVNVSFVSDALTDVTLTKAGTRSIKLGKFDNKKLALKPGRYVLDGMRLGFQDVRQDLEVLPGQSGVLSVSIRCEKAVGSLANASET